MIKLKNIFTLFLLSISLIFSVSSTTALASEQKILVAYFGRLGNTNYSEDIDATASASIVVENGNRFGTTEMIGRIIQRNVGGDLYLIQTEEEYPEEFDDVVTQARSERQRDYVPKLVNNIENFDEYDTIFLGYPVWGNTIPAPVQAFLKQYDFKNKTIITFCTHDGYGRGMSTRAIREAVSGVNVIEGIALESNDIERTSMENIEAEVKNWLETVPEITMNRTTTEISILAGGQRLKGVLYDTPTAREFLKMLPQEISMYGYGNREYYGGIENEIETTETGNLNFEDGDITYCPQNNSIAIFYSQSDNPNLTMRVIPIGKVTDKLDVFHNLSRRETITFLSE